MPKTEKYVEGFHFEHLQQTNSVTVLLLGPRLPSGGGNILLTHLWTTAACCAVTGPLKQSHSNTDQLDKLANIALHFKGR